MRSNLEELISHMDNLEGLPREWFKESSLNVLDEQPVSKESETWENLRNEVLNCKKCRLCETRTKVVFGAGNYSKPPLAFAGEGPGAQEDIQGEPFVGAAGKLLTDAITKGMKLRREDVYIANVVKCRPPENRTPLPDEVASCIGYLERQLEFIQPKVIVTLGQPAQKAICGLEDGISKIRGKWQKWRGIPVMPTFHPAYLLRNASKKREFWEDLKLVMEKLGMEIEK